MLYFFPGLFFLLFFLFLVIYSGFGVLDFGVAVLHWAFGVGAFSGLGLGPVVWGPTRFFCGLGSL